MYGNNDPEHERLVEEMDRAREYFISECEKRRVSSTTPQPKQEQGEPVANPFADIHDKRIGEMTAEQQDRAIEFWLRQQKGWLPMSQREHVEALLRVIDKLRTTSQPRKPMSDEQVENWYGESHRGFSIEREDYFKAFRDAEKAHGIKE